MEYFTIYLVVLAQRTFSFLDPCWTCLVLASVLLRDRLGLWVRFVAVSRGLLCSAVLFVVDAYCQFAILFLLLLSLYYYYYLLCCTLMRVKITNRPHLASVAMRPNNNIAVTGCTIIYDPVTL